MKTTKEFPATHSMSTEWFVVDEDGNKCLRIYSGSLSNIDYRPFEKESTETKPQYHLKYPPRILP